MIVLLALAIALQRPLDHWVYELSLRLEKNYDEH